MRFMRIRINFQRADLVKVTDGKIAALIQSSVSVLYEESELGRFIRVLINKS